MAKVHLNSTLKVPNLLSSGSKPLNNKICEEKQFSPRQTEKHPVADVDLLLFLIAQCQMTDTCMLPGDCDGCCFPSSCLSSQIPHCHAGKGMHLQAYPREAVPRASLQMLAPPNQALASSNLQENKSWHEPLT